MKIIRTTDSDFSAALEEIRRRGEADTSRVEAAVREIIDDVKARGDRAVLDYTARFDGVAMKRSAMRVSRREMNGALKGIPRGDVRLLELAAERIERFHARQRGNSWFVTEEDGTVLGQRVTPIARAGLYVPGGKAAYPSTVLMNAVPARVAGVGSLVMTTPAAGSDINPYVLAAAAVAGVDEVYRIGGAQAVAAMAFGTETIAAVDKIVGPGNIYVATAKRLVFGAVDIDMVAGPSEILVINDGTGDPRWIAADLLGQAEHDELASSILVTTSERTARRVAAAVKRGLAKLRRKDIAASSIERYGVVIVAASLEEAAEISNRIAPEHLELFVDDPWALLGRIRNAGAVFLGRTTPEAAGDYLAGPNHTLPTGGTARFSSPLGVDDFVKRSSVLSFSQAALERLGPSIERFAALEGLDAHGRSVTVRLEKP
ncbi:MAG TPA: histidinol dehydrogenase [Deltaproteobacteria bacterium]|nr:histidinol dehydrogenase [Deltaproteobacteria bacterium]